MSPRCSKVHPSNYRVEGFVESTTVAELATLDVPVIADIGSGLIDANCPWLGGAPPAWLHGEPAARQTFEDGAALVTFSGDKLFGGPQAGVIAGRADMVTLCEQHPLARALRPGGHVMAAMQRTALAYLGKTAAIEIPFWAMANATIDDLRSACGDDRCNCRHRRGRLDPGSTGSRLGSRYDDSVDRHPAQRRPPRRTAIVRPTDCRPGARRVDVAGSRTIDPGSDGAVAAAMRRCV